MLEKCERLSARQAAVGSVAVGFDDTVAVLVTAHVAHVNERKVQDELVEVDAVILDDLAKGLDEKISRAFAHIEVSGLAAHVLALTRVMNDPFIQLLAAVAAGDDDWQSHRLTKRFQRVEAKRLQVLHRLCGRGVRDTVLLYRPALDELLQLEVRR